MQNSFGARWGWYSMIEKLAQGDITKFEEVSKQNFISALNLLTFWMEKDREINKKQKH
jgi:hypothetical protein